MHAHTHLQHLFVPTFVSCSFPLLALCLQTVEAQQYAAGGVNDVRALCSLLGAICCVLAAVCHHTSRKNIFIVHVSVMSHCTVGVCECLVFHFSVALHIKNHESPSRPPCQTTLRQLYWSVRVCNHSFLFMRSLLCVTLPFFFKIQICLLYFMPNVFMLCFLCDVWVSVKVLT